jgi:hypothetical protein
MSGQPQTGSAYAHINTLTTGVLKSGKGSLIAVSINTKGATANLLTLFDNTAASGTVIGVFDTTAQPVTLLLLLDFQVGLSFTLAAGTAADLTISFS